MPLHPPIDAAVTRTAVFTSCAANYIPKARVLGSSLKQFHADLDLYLLLVDDRPTFPAFLVEPFDAIVTAAELDIPDFESWIFGHGLVEACTAVKPYMLLSLLQKGYDHVVYLDPDIAVFSPLTELLCDFTRHSILLTPHQCKPESDPEAIKDNEICSLRHGLFNLGFVGVKNDAEGVRYAHWWADRCRYACYEDIPNGVFTDQKWNDFVPIFFPGAGILRSPAYNVATWNYSQRLIEGMPETRVTVDGVPLVFHHFTGYDSGAHHVMLAKYGSHMPATSLLSQWYEQRCRALAMPEVSALPWAYGRYSNGEAVHALHRRLYRGRKDLQEAFPRPRDAAPGGRPDSSLVHWLKHEHHWDGDLRIPDRTFQAYLAAMESELRAHVALSEQLRPWMKRIVKPCIRGSFAIARRLVG